MEQPDDLESMIVPTVWTDKDTDIVVQAEIYRKLGLKPVTELD